MFTLEVIVDGLLAHDATLLFGERLLGVLEPAIYSPEVERGVLPEVADDDLEGGEPIEDAVGHEAKEVQANAVGERQRRPTCSGSCMDSGAKAPRRSRWPASRRRRGRPGPWMPGTVSETMV